MTFREAAAKALRDGRVEQVTIDEDEGYDLFRIQVWFNHEGKSYCYQSKPFCGMDQQDFGNEIAKRLERLGMPRAEVVKWIEKNIDISQIDLSLLFAKKLTREGRVPPFVMAHLRSMIRSNGGDFPTLPQSKSK